MGKTELVFVPTPMMGHLLSTVEVAKLILQRDHRISVVILIINFPHDFASVNAYVDSESREADPAGLTFVTLPALPSPLDPSSKNFFNTFIELHKPSVKQAVLDRVKSGSPKPAGFVLDLFCTAMIDVANELHVPSYIFFTSGASLLNLMFHLQSLADDHEKKVDVAEEFSDPDKEFDLPGFRNRVPGKVVPSVFLDKEGGCDLILNHARRFRESKGILVNTYMELESHPLQALLDQAEKQKIPAVYPVGPILELGSKSRDGSRHKEEHDSIMEWLDQQPPSSVVFLCFGSMGCFDEVQVKEIADGLDRAGHRFLWSLRRPPPEGKPAMPSQHETFTDALPEGFLERTARRGKIIAWAPQVAILAHQAVGGFVSHCGWNSTLESLWFGVPMAAWPLYAEQQLNAFELVKELGVAVEIRMDYRRDWRTRKGNFVVTADEIENGVKKLMSTGEKMRAKVKEISMGEKGRKALQDGGSSHHSLGRFVADLISTCLG